MRSRRVSSGTLAGWLPFLITSNAFDSTERGRDGRACREPAARQHEHKAPERRDGDRFAKEDGPSTTATAGFTNVINVARIGPTSAISAKKKTNATASVQPRRVIASCTEPT
jgi:hypothetical protein